MSDDSFLEFLSRRHFLPSFNLPIDSIVFVARTAENGQEEIEVRMADGLEKALTGYGPGRELMNMKKQYVVGGMYLEFPPSRVPPDAERNEDNAREKMMDKINRFETWFNKANSDDISWYHMCRRCMHTLESDNNPKETPELESNCPMCAVSVDNWLSRPLIRPPGFAPLIQTMSQFGRAKTVDKDARDAPTYRLATRWPTQLQDMNDLGPDLVELGEAGARMALIKGKKIVDVNPGLADLTKPDEVGFEFCKLCGTLDVQRLKPEHHRPYAIPYSDGLYSGIKPYDVLRGEFDDLRKAKCNPGHHNRTIDGFSRIILGRRFTSDLLVLDVPWPDKNFISPHSPNENDPNPGLARAAAVSICQALLQAATSGNCGLAISPTDVGGDVRHYYDEENESRGFHVFLYEKADGGAGLLQALFTKMREEFDGLDNPGSVIDDLFSILSGGRCSTQVQYDSEGSEHEIRTPCSSICNGCLLDFTTQYMADQLDRELGYHLLMQALFGQLDAEKMNLSTDNRRLHLLIEEAVRESGLDDHEVELIISQNKIEGEKHGDGDLPAEIEDTLRAVIGVRAGEHEFSVISTLQDVLDDELQFRAWQVRNDPEGVISSVRKMLGDDDGGGALASLLG